MGIDGAFAENAVGVTHQVKVCQNAFHQIHPLFLLVKGFIVENVLSHAEEEAGKPLANGGKINAVSAVSAVHHHQAVFHAVEIGLLQKARYPFAMKIHPRFPKPELILVQACGVAGDHGSETLTAEASWDDVAVIFRKFRDAPVAEAALHVPLVVALPQIIVPKYGLDPKIPNFRNKRDHIPCEGGGNGVAPADELSIYVPTDMPALVGGVAGGIKPLGMSQRDGEGDHFKALLGQKAKASGKLFQRNGKGHVVAQDHKALDMSGAHHGKPAGGFCPLQNRLRPGRGPKIHHRLLLDIGVTAVADLLKQLSGQTVSAQRAEAVLLPVLGQKGAGDEGGTLHNEIFTVGKGHVDQLFTTGKGGACNDANGIGNIDLAEKAQLSMTSSSEGKTTAST